MNNSLIHSLIFFWFVLFFFTSYWNCANIVSTDFFLGNNLIEVAIEANRRRQPSTNTVNVNNRRRAKRSTFYSTLHHLL